MRLKIELMMGHKTNIELMMGHETKYRTYDGAWD